jgi:hypothetical protein
MTIQKIILPKASLLVNTAYDYMDSYKTEVAYAQNESFDVVQVGKAFFSSSPKWISILFELRNKVVSIFGLKTNGDMQNKEALLRNFKGNEGERLGLFKVFNRSENELILGEDDKHLDFRVSLLQVPLSSSNAELTISTTVKFHNAFGRSYFFLVKPFHKLIVQTMLKGIVHQLGKNI